MKYEYYMRGNNTSDTHFYRVKGQSIEYYYRGNFSASGWYQSNDYVITESYVIHWKGLIGAEVILRPIPKLMILLALGNEGVI